MAFMIGNHSELNQAMALCLPSFKRIFFFFFYRCHLKGDKINTKKPVELQPIKLIYKCKIKPDFIDGMAVTFLDFGNLFIECLPTIMYNVFYEAHMKCTLL